MKKSLATVLIPLACASVLVAMWAGPLSAQKPFLGVARTQYNLQEKIAKCALCHEANKGPKRETLNVYGKALQAEAAIKPALDQKSSHAWTDQELAAVGKALTALEDKDADGDGATNKEEMLLGTWPGDAASKPDAKTLAQFREAQAKAEAKKKEGETKK